MCGTSNCNTEIPRFGTLFHVVRLEETAESVEEEWEGKGETTRVREEWSGDGWGGGGGGGTTDRKHSNPICVGRINKA
jgi:hypothetical protein